MSFTVDLLWAIVGLTMVPVVWESVYSLARYRLAEHRCGDFGLVVSAANVAVHEVTPSSQLSNTETDSGSPLSLVLSTLYSMPSDLPMLTLDQQASRVQPLVMPAYDMANSVCASCVAVSPPLSHFGLSMQPSVAALRWTRDAARPYDGPPVYPDLRIPYSFGDQVPLNIRSPEGRRTR
jgi:hypothetical protein